MTCAELLKELLTRCVKLGVVGDRLCWRGEVVPEEIEALRRYKSLLMPVVATLGNQTPIPLPNAYQGRYLEDFSSWMSLSRFETTHLPVEPPRAYLSYFGNSVAREFGDEVAERLDSLALEYERSPKWDQVRIRCMFWAEWRKGKAIAKVNQAVVGANQAHDSFET